MFSLGFIVCLFSLSLTTQIIYCLTYKNLTTVYFHLSLPSFVPLLYVFTYTYFKLYNTLLIFKLYIANYILKKFKHEWKTFRMTSVLFIPLCRPRLSSAVFFHSEELTVIFLVLQYGTEKFSDFCLKLFISLSHFYHIWNNRVTFFFFQQLSDAIPFIMVCIVSDEKSTKNYYLCFLICMCIFPPGCS